jgi:hypothetical protein
VETETVGVDAIVRRLVDHLALALCNLVVHAVEPGLGCSHAGVDRIAAPADHGSTSHSDASMLPGFQPEDKGPQPVAVEARRDSVA